MGSVFKKVIFYILIFTLIFPIIFYFIGSLSFLKVSSPILIYSYNTGLKDKSLNELSVKGIDKAFESNSKGYKYSTLQTTATESEMTNVFNVAIDNGTRVIFIGGFEQLYWVKKNHDKIPDDVYIIYSDDSDKELFSPKYNDVKSLYFDSSQASFVAGVVSSIYLVSNFSNPDDWKIGTWGGVPITAVINIMSGFESGINFFNEFLLNKDIFSHEKVELISPGDEENPSEWYSNFFIANEVGALFANTLIDKGAKLLFPVAGGQTNNAMSAINNTKENVMLIGIDSDAKELFPNSQDKVLTSIIKNFEKAAYESVQGIFEDDEEIRNEMLTQDVEYNWENNGVYLTDVNEDDLLNKAYKDFIEKEYFSDEAQKVIDENELDSVSKFVDHIAIKAVENNLIDENSDTFIVV